MAQDTVGVSLNKRIWPKGQAVGCGRRRYAGLSERRGRRKLWRQTQALRFKCVGEWKNFALFLFFEDIEMLFPILLNKQEHDISTKQQLDHSVPQASHYILSGNGPGGAL
jgi:hypothetical protein